MLRACKLRGSRKSRLVPTSLTLHHGVNMMQGNKKFYVVRTHFNTCVHGLSGTSEEAGVLSDQPATNVGSPVECIELQKRLDQLGVHISSSNCADVLHIFKESKVSPHGKRIYRLISKTTGNVDNCLESLLVQMFIENKALQHARLLVVKLPHVNLLVWNCLIESYAQQGLCTKAFGAFVLMQEKGVLPDKVTFVNVLSACNSPFHLTKGKCLHHMVICIGCEFDVVLGTTLLTMYSKSGSLEDCATMFAYMEVRNVVSWTVMIGAHARDALFAEAFHLHDQMKQEGVLPNRVTFLSLLEACSCQEMLVNGKQLHTVAVDMDMHMSAALLHMYGKCGTFEDAQALFNHTQERDIVMWNALITAAVRHNLCSEAAQMFYSMMNEGMIPNIVTYVTMIPACICCPSSIGKSMHTRIISSGFEDYIVVATALMNMYGKLGSLDTAILLFNNMKERNVVSWNTMIVLHAERGDMEGALQFLDNQQHQGVWANDVTYVSSLEALSGKEALRAKRLHCCIIQSDYGTNVAVATALANTYCRLGNFKDGHKVFKKMAKRNLISWNTMLSASCLYGRGMQGFRFFKQMQREGIVPDQLTYISILSICANQLVLLTLGKALHHSIMHSGCEPSAIVAASLLDMYGKCGSLEDARNIFDRMSKQSVVVWNAMISSYAQHGRIEDAFTMVDAMRQVDITPNNVTFLSLLAGCSHTGMLVEACSNARLMNICGIKARCEQFRCLIDLLGRAGRVEEAEVALYKMPLKPSLIAWMTLLGTCRHVFDVKQAGHIVEHILEYDLGNSAAHRLLASVNS